MLLVQLFLFHYNKYCKIPKISPGAYSLYFSKALFEGFIFGGSYMQRGLSTEGNLHLKINWASLIVGSKFTIFALFYFVFEGNFPSTSPRGAYIWRGDLMEGFLRYRFGVLIFGGAYTWRGLFSKFYSMLWLSFIGGLSSNSRLCLSASPPSKTFKIQ